MAYSSMDCFDLVLPALTLPDGFAIRPAVESAFGDSSEMVLRTGDLTIGQVNTDPSPWMRHVIEKTDLSIADGAQSVAAGAQLNGLEAPFVARWFRAISEFLDAQPCWIACAEEGCDDGVFVPRRGEASAVVERIKTHLAHPASDWTMLIYRAPSADLPTAQLR